MDALHCRRDTAQAIVEREGEGDYVLAVKSNQPGLLRSAKATIAQAERKQARKVTTRDAGHGRKEVRTARLTCLELAALSRVAGFDGPNLSAQRIPGL